MSSKTVVDVVKSEGDERDYRGLVLGNGMKVLLVSDPTTDKAAAAMDVNVGHMSDPIPGLAHFCEHMLFLGTKKYPDENEYTKYLSQVTEITWYDNTQTKKKKINIAQLMAHVHILFYF